MPLRPWHQHWGILRPDVKSQYMVSTCCKPGWCTSYFRTAVDKMPVETASASVSTPREEALTLPPKEISQTFWGNNRDPREVPRI